MVSAGITPAVDMANLSSFISAGMIRPLIFADDEMYSSAPPTLAVTKQSSSSVNSPNPGQSFSHTDDLPPSSLTTSNSSDALYALYPKYSPTFSSSLNPASAPFRPMSLPSLSSAGGSNIADLKGKSRAMDTDVEPISKAPANGVNSNSTTTNLLDPSLSPPQGLKRQEFVRVVLQALRDVGYGQTATVLEAESGIEQEPLIASSLKAAVIGGRWSETIQLLVELGVVNEKDRARLAKKRTSSASMAMSADADSQMSNTVPAQGQTQVAINGHGELSLGPDGNPTSRQEVNHVQSTQNGRSKRRASGNGNGNGIDNDSHNPNSIGRQALFMILRQKYLELLELGQIKRALTVLRSELAHLAPHSDELHALSGYIVCVNRDDLYKRSHWDGVNGSSRKLLLKKLQRECSCRLSLEPSSWTLK